MSEQKARRTVEDIARELNDLQRDYELKMFDLHEDRIYHLAFLHQEWQALTGKDDIAWSEFLKRSSTSGNHDRA